MKRGGPDPGNNEFHPLPFGVFNERGIDVPESVVQSLTIAFHASL
jgi:hypothetical protein